jgi:hypothetical protein
MSRLRFVGVFLPYAAGYFLSNVFRRVNTVIAADLTLEFHLSAAYLGLLTDVYFLTFAVAQLPLVTLLDQLETNIVQSVPLAPVHYARCIDGIVSLDGSTHRTRSFRERATTIDNIMRIRCLSRSTVLAHHSALSLRHRQLLILTEFLSRILDASRAAGPGR